MIIEIMLIILAIISVIVNTIVSVIIIKDTLNNRKWQDRIDREINKQTNITDKEFSDRCRDATDFAVFHLKDMMQPNQNSLTQLAEVKDQLKQNNQQAEANSVKIAMNSLYGKQANTPPTDISNTTH